MRAPIAKYVQKIEAKKNGRFMMNDSSFGGSSRLKYVIVKLEALLS